MKVRPSEGRPLSIVAAYSITIVNLLQGQPQDICSGHELSQRSLMLPPNAFCGLLKFSDNESRLDDLIEGKIYANTPEYFRMHPAPGISDTAESVTFSYRRERGDPDPVLKIDDHEISDIQTFTIRGAGGPDRWLHSWMILRFPADEAALRSLVADLTRMRTEFGEHYAYVRPDLFDEFAKVVGAASPVPTRFAEVVYDDNPINFSPECKAKQYAYQREGRFLFGECSDRSQEPLVFEREGGFSEWVSKDMGIRMFNKKTDETLLAMEGPDLFESGI